MKPKIIAVINLIALTASSFQPVYAATQEELQKREAALTERAVILSDREINLDDKEQELNRKSEELKAIEKKIHAQRIENSVREIEFDDMAAKFNRDSELLAARNIELAKDFQRVEEMKAEIDKKSQEAELLAREADQKLKQAETRELQAAKREREITKREGELAANLSQINLDRADALMSGENDSELQKKLADIDLREKNLRTAQEIFAGEKEKLAGEKSSLETLKADAEKSISEANALKAAAEEKSKKADAVIALNEEQKALIAKLEKDIEDKNAEIKALFEVKSGPLTAELASDVPANSSITVTDKGMMNWSDGSIRAKGLGIPPEGKSGEQAKALARRAAIVDLQRNLLETIEGVKIESKTTVKDFMASDSITSAVAGTIRGVEVIEEKWDGKSYTVLGQVKQENMSGTMSEVTKKIKMGRVPAEPKKKNGNYTGLIVDTRHLNLEQQKYFHIVDEAGKLVYGIEYADRKIQSRIGLCAYFTRIVFESDETRVGDNPLVIKAQGLANDNTDIVIPNDAANQIRRNKVNFRKECKVIVVKDNA